MGITKYLDGGFLLPVILMRIPVLEGWNGGVMELLVFKGWIWGLIIVS